MGKKIEIGDRVAHRINGFEGIATGSTEYINGCRQYLVAPEALDKDGKIVEGQWIDEQHLQIVDKGVFENPFAVGAPASAGGPDRAKRATQ